MVFGHKEVHQIKKRCFGGRLCYAWKDLTDTLQTCFWSLEGFFMSFFRVVIHLLVQCRF